MVYQDFHPFLKDSLSRKKRVVCFYLQLSDNFATIKFQDLQVRETKIPLPRKKKTEQERTINMSTVSVITSTQQPKASYSHVLRPVVRFLTTLKSHIPDFGLTSQSTIVPWLNWEDYIIIPAFVCCRFRTDLALLFYISRFRN